MSKIIETSGGAVLRVWSYCVTVMFWLITVAVNAPGHLSYDSIVQLNEARSRAYAGGHPPFMSYLLMIFDNIVPGTALFLVFMQSLFFGAILIVIAHARRLTIVSPLLIAALCLHPLVLVYQGIVWKDVLFANLVVFAFALIFAGERHTRTTRRMMFVAGLICGAAGALTRQNGFVAEIVIAALVIYLETGSRTSLAARGTLLLLSPVVAILVIAPLAAATNALISANATALPGSTLSIGLRGLMQYDIIGTLANNHQIDVRFLDERGLDSAMIRGIAKQYYQPDRMDWLSDAKDFEAAFAKLSDGELRSVWFRLIKENPLTYLQHRMAVYHWMIWPPKIYACLPIHIGVSVQPKDLIQKLELQEGKRPQDQALYRYSTGFINNLTYRHAFFGFLAISLGVILALRPGIGKTKSILALLAAALLFSLSFFFIGIACDFRYMYLLPVSVCLAIIMSSAVIAEAVPDHLWTSMTFSATAKLLHARSYWNLLQRMRR